MRFFHEQNKTKLWGMLAAFVTLLVVVAISCKKKEDNPTTTGGSAVTSFTGTWTGPVTHSLAAGGSCSTPFNEGPTTITVVATESAGAVTGKIEPYPQFVLGTIDAFTGTIDSNRMLTAHDTTSTSQQSFTATVSGSSMTFTYIGTSIRSDCGQGVQVAVSGGGTLTKQ